MGRQRHGGAGCGARPRRSGRCAADSPALLGRGARRRTRFVRFVLCAQTAAASQTTRRAARAAPPPALLGASHARRSPHPRAFAAAAGFARATQLLALAAGGARPGRCGEATSSAGSRAARAQRALRGLTCRSCLSAVSEANVASSAARPRPSSAVQSARSADRSGQRPGRAPPAATPHHTTDTDDGTARNQGPENPLQDRRRLAPRRRRRRHLDRARPDRVRGRRIGLRQDGDGDDRAEAAADAAGKDRRRPGAVAGPRPGHGERRGDAPGPRQGDRDHLPGADDLAQPGLQHRRADRRVDPAARGAGAQGGDGPRGRDAGAGAHPDAAAPGQRLSAPVLGRHAPARHDRHRPGLQPEAADRRRAHHRARRHDPGADPRPARRAEGSAGHGDHADHPRDGRGRRGGAAGRRHVRRHGGRGGERRGAVRQSAPSLHPGPDPLDPAHRHRRAAQGAARADPGHGAQARRSGRRLPVRAALQVRHARLRQGDAGAARAGRRPQGALHLRHRPQPRAPRHRSPERLA